MSDFDKALLAQLESTKTATNQAVRREAAIRSQIALSGVGRPPADDRPGTGVATVDDKMKAILDIFDIQEKTGITFIMLGDLARAIREKQNWYDGDKIECGFAASNLVPEVKGLFKTWGFEETSYGYKYFFSPPTKWDVKIPVEIHCWKKKYAFFDNPDVGFFGVDDYKLPNPFNAYWKVRGIIK